MKKDEEIFQEHIMSQSNSNPKFENESANLGSAKFSKNEILTKPAEILMSLILPTVANRLKYHNEIIKLNRSKT